jgi:hypothetical protein
MQGRACRGLQGTPYTTPYGITENLPGLAALEQ